MSTISIKEYHVDFPYERAYELQKAYMEKVISCLDEKRHGVLESPTGTGKTLCLFAPLTSWMKHKEIGEQLLNKKLNHDKSEPATDGTAKKEISTCTDIQTNKTRIWYTSRTHAQIAQAVSELKKCNTENLNMIIIGSRDQLCINKEVQEEKEFYVKSQKCQELTRKTPSMCEFYLPEKFSFLNDAFFKKGEIKDIEDLITIGNACKVCPYYASKKAWESADIILLPYNYILDIALRSATKFDFKDAIIIFDEGHNVPSKCEESFEFQLAAEDLDLGIISVRLLWKNLDIKINSGKIKNNDELKLIKTHLENSRSIVQILHKLNQVFKNLHLQKKMLPLSSVYQFYEEAGITRHTACKLLCAIAEFKKDSEYLKLNNSVLTIFYLLEKMVNCLYSPILDLYDKNTIDLSFKCAITKEDDGPKTLSLFCFNPSFGIQALLRLEPSSLIITSGTLSPLNTFIHELGLPDPITLENPHIAKKCQVPFMILGTGVSNHPLDGSFKKRSDMDYMISLGNSLTNLIGSVPDGVLLLFSSYTMMNQLKRTWKSHNGIWNRLNSLKRVYIEPRGKEDFINCMENYRRAIGSGNGAILMGVLRGKISEGMDFKDQYCRAVFIISVPYPPVDDPKVFGKNEFAQSYKFLNPKTNQVERLYESYFSEEAMKATNQAIGRVIRHSQDYGAIILVDSRFTERRLFFGLSSWIRESGPIAKNYSEAKRLLVQFFKDVHTGKLGVPEIRCQKVNSNGCPIADDIYFEKYNIRSIEKTPKAENTLVVDSVNRIKSQSVITDENDNDAAEGPSLSFSRNVKKNLGPLFEKLGDSPSTSLRGFSQLNLSDRLELISSGTSKRKLFLDESNRQISKSPRKDKNNESYCDKSTVTFTED